MGRRHTGSECWKAKGALWKLPCFASKREKLWSALFDPTCCEPHFSSNRSCRTNSVLNHTFSFLEVKKLSLTWRNNTATNGEYFKFHLSLPSQALKWKDRASESSVLALLKAFPVNLFVNLSGSNLKLVVSYSHHSLWKAVSEPCIFESYLGENIWVSSLFSLLEQFGSRIMKKYYKPLFVLPW